MKKKHNFTNKLIQIHKLKIKFFFDFSKIIFFLMNNKQKISKLIYFFINPYLITQNFKKF